MDPARREQLQEDGRRWEAQNRELERHAPAGWVPQPLNRARFAAFWDTDQRQRTLNGRLQATASLAILFVGTYATATAGARRLGYEPGLGAWFTVIAAAISTQLVVLGVLGIVLRVNRSLWPAFVFAAFAAVPALVGRQWSLALAGAAAGLVILLVALLAWQPIGYLARALAPQDVRAFTTVRMADSLALMVCGEIPRLSSTAPKVKTVVVNWKEPEGRRVLAGQLEHTSRVLLSQAVQVVPLPFTAVTRDAMRHYQKRVAAGFAALAMEVTLADSSKDEAVLASIMAGYQAVRDEQWNALALAEPISARKAAARVVAERAVTVGALVALALWVVPVVPLISDAVQATVQTVLFAAAVFAVTSPRKAITSIRDSLTVALSPK